MPFASYRRPSIQIGLLKAEAARAGFAADTFHLKLDFAVEVGPLKYELWCGATGHNLGDWMFSVAAFGDDAPDREGFFLEAYRQELEKPLARVGSSLDDLVRVRTEIVPTYLKRLTQEIGWGEYDVVAFSSVFQQNAASFALAAALKERHPRLQTLFGGANFDGEMGEEWVRAVPSIDWAVTGEADHAFPAFLVALARGEDPAGVPGVLCRREGRVSSKPPTPPPEDMDAQPVPDYDEYFVRARRLGLLPTTGPPPVWVPFESARGCWWGARRHCTFCGLNGSTMRFRSKSPDRVERELAELATRHGSRDFAAVDNILEPAYIDTLFRRFAETRPGYRIHYEVKANLTPDELRVLKAGGVATMQPGIESLDSRVLALMRKGVRAAQNVNLLRWSTHLGIELIWNMIWGFPGEPEDAAAAQAALAPKLAHLQPPAALSRVRIDRFSPIFEDEAAFPRRWIRPETSQSYVYPPAVTLERAAYEFDGELEGAWPDAHYQVLQETLVAWKAAWRRSPRPACTYSLCNGTVRVLDTRAPDTSVEHHLVGDEAALLLACNDRPRTAADAVVSASDSIPIGRARDILDELATAGLLFRDGNLFVTLPLPEEGLRKELANDRTDN